MSVMFFATSDGDRPGMCIDGVLDELRDCLERIALRECDDPNRIPVVADLESTAIFILRSTRHESTKSPDLICSRTLIHDLHGVIAVATLDSVGLEVAPVDRENLTGIECFGCDDERCVGQVHGTITVRFHELKCPDQP